ncbi:MAG: T9SS type A sorting domain-containing protein [Bacteroidales bacterium]|nr:T9SS type A sorting domain-containing protein [Bacteroidales bacterium]
MNVVSRNVLLSVFLLALLIIPKKLDAQGLVVPVGTYISVPSDANIRLGSSDSLTIQSTASGTGSLISNGTFTGAAKVQRYMTGAKWHIVSSPVSGQSFTNFILDGANNIPWLSGTNPVQYGIMEYDEANDKWSTPFIAAKSGDFVTSQGYSVRNRADGVMTFKGSGILTGNQTVTLIRGKYGWNCIGNPFTSVIQVKGLGGILADNLNNLDQNYAGIYVWDEQPNYNNSGLKKDYRIHCNTPYTFPFSIQETADTYIAVGQGFFMKSKTGGGTFTFTQAMKSHQSGVAFRSANESWPAIRLQANGNNLVSTTVVAFGSEMTNGLDPSFDVAMLKGNPNFALFTRLVESDGLDYAVQALPETFDDDGMIAIGLDCAVGADITFKLEQAFLPTDSKVTLEDRQTSTFTTFVDDQTSYTTNIATNTKGIGRFYLHITNLGTGITSNQSNRFLVYGNGDRILLKGNFREVTEVTIYTTDGKFVEKITPKEDVILQTKSHTRGVYIVRIDGNNIHSSHRVLL